MAPLILIALIFVGCSRERVTQSVTDPNQVETVIVSANPDRCAQSLESQGARVLHKGTAGLLLVDKSLTGLDVSRCEAAVSPNERLVIHPPVQSTQKPDLPTVLRLIPAEEIGARSFIKANSHFDGRAVTVAILDTGVEVDHPMLSINPDGSRKITDFDDFSGEGRVELKDATAEGGKVSLPGGAVYQTGPITGSVRIGVFPGSTLIYSEDVAAKDTFTDVGVLAYEVSGEWLVRIDTNDNKDFSDDKELTDFSKTGAYTRLGAKGSLTTSVAIRSQGRVVNLCFDDGTHGTHVAGIAAGYQAGGLVGVAPGANVLAAKIGDNRLSGGSTTTASMLLAIDWAVQRGARIINLSYGIGSGTNIGKSLIDQYVDKVAREKDILFSISAGNEGPGLQTIGTPAGADLAITNGAYLSEATARDNYGYLGFRENGLWFFSSVGPRLDGGLKPSLLSPGAALSSVPGFASGYANYRGTSMASPQTTGGLALLLSAAKQTGLPVDRVSVTQAVYRSAKSVPGLSIVEQGHGLFDVPGAFRSLSEAKDEPVIEYSVSVNSPLSPEGTGRGVFVRGATPPANGFTAAITASGSAFLRTFRLEASAPWIRVPENLWFVSGTKTFQVDIDPTLFERAGLHSEKITAIDEAAGRVAFVVPVTVVVPETLANSIAQTVEVSPGKTARIFINIPPGATSAILELTSSGSAVWANLNDPFGKISITLRDSEATLPQPRLNGQTQIVRPGVYEIVVTASLVNRESVTASVSLQLFGLRVEKEVTAEPLKFQILATSVLGAVKIVPKLVQKVDKKTTQTVVQGDLSIFPFLVSKEDIARYAEIEFRTRVSKTVYDKMTDFPYRVFDAKRNLVASGGLDFESRFVLALADLAAGAFELEIQGAFTHAMSSPWALEVEQVRVRKETITLHQYDRMLIESGQTRRLEVDISKLTPNPEGSTCATLVMELPDGRSVQELDLCTPSRELITRQDVDSEEAGIRPLLITEP